MQFMNLQPEIPTAELLVPKPSYKEVKPADGILKYYFLSINLIPHNYSKQAA
jgi:hypothetical protein